MLDGDRLGETRLFLMYQANIADLSHYFGKLSDYPDMHEEYHLSEPNCTFLIDIFDLSNQSIDKQLTLLQPAIKQTIDAKL